MEVNGGLSFIWHGFNRDKSKREKQCYYEWNCLVCWLRTLFAIIRIGVRLKCWKETKN